jgi:hypothetical protein
MVRRLDTGIGAAVRAEREATGLERLIEGILRLVSREKDTPGAGVEPGSAGPGVAAVSGRLRALRGRGTDR